MDVFAGEGGLRMAAAQHVVLLASQLLLPLLVRLADLVAAVAWVAFLRRIGTLPWLQAL